MLRRRLKEKQEYIMNRNEKKEYENKKEELSEALKTNKPIPHHLRGEAKQLLDEMIYDIKEEKVHSLPNVVVTTSHGPSSLLKSFAKHVSLIFNGVHLVRGKMTNEALSEYCINNGVTHLIILHEVKGNPSTFILCKYPHGPTYSFSLFNLKYQRRQKTFGEKPYLVMDGLSSEIGEALKQNLSLCFPRVEDGNRLVAFINKNGTVAFRHFLIEKRKLIKECEFDLKLFKIVNSTFDMDGDVGYVLKAYTNTLKQDVLTEEKE
ncbi:U3 small nucleolar ribonucleoprotein IMP4 [Enteropsectra breve]|nr:U3 small nucleolar ribonucleoprotein IMP4 [Enteropsectra breve]